MAMSNMIRHTTSRDIRRAMRWILHIVRREAPLSTINLPATENMLKHTYVLRFAVDPQFDHVTFFASSPGSGWNSSMLTLFTVGSGCVHTAHVCMDVHEEHHITEHHECATCAREDVNGDVQNTDRNMLKMTYNQLSSTKLAMSNA